MPRKVIAKMPGGTVIVLALMALVALVGYNTFIKAETVGPSIPGAPPASIAPAGTSGCPDTLATTIYTRHRNSLNSSESYTAVEYAVYDKGSGDFLTNITTLSGTSGTYTNTGSVTWCGKTITLYPLTANNANSLLKSVSVAGGIGKLVSANGVEGTGIELDVSSGDIRLDINGRSSGKTLEVRVYDDTNRAYFIEERESTGSTWHALDANGNYTAQYGTTSAGGSADAIGSGGQLAQTLEVRASENYVEHGNLGMLVMVDVGSSASTYWNDFSITVNGDAIAEGSASMTAYEAKRFSAQDYVFVVEGKSISRSPTTKIGLVMDATSNDPSDDVKITIAPRGVYKTQAGAVAIGAAKDDTSYSTVLWEAEIIKNIS